MVDRPRRAPYHPAFRTDPGAVPEGRGIGGPPGSRPSTPVLPWPWPFTGPDPREDLWTTVRYRRQERDRKATVLRASGLALMLLGAGTVAFLSFNAWRATREAGEAQQRLAEEFQQSQATTPATIEDPTIGMAPTTSTAPVTTHPGAGTIETTTTTGPALVTESPPAEGAPLGRILIPRAGIDWVVVEGVAPEDLAQGPGHMPGTAMPGQPGNAVISGHRTTHGAPFRDLDALQLGDEIQVITLIGTHTFEVVEVRAVAPTDVWVTSQVDGAWLTLTTCHPEGSSRQRLVVFARLVAGPNAAAIPADTAPPHSG